MALPHLGSTIVGILGVTAVITILGVGITGATATVGAAHGVGTDGIIGVGTTGATAMDMDMDMDTMAIDIITVIMETTTTAVMATTATHTIEVEEVIITPIQLQAIAQLEI